MNQQLIEDDKLISRKRDAKNAIEVLNCSNHTRMNQ